MANLLYPTFKQALLKALVADLSAVGTDVRILVVDNADYTYSAAHDFLDDVPAIGRVAVSTALANKTVSATGVFDADDKTITAVTGDQSEVIIIYIDTGVEATSRLIAFFDTSITGMPFTPNGGALDVVFNAAGIFQL